MLIIKVYKIQEDHKPLDYNHYLINKMIVSFDLTWLRRTAITYLDNIFSHNALLPSPE